MKVDRGAVRYRGWSHVRLGRIRGIFVIAANRQTGHFPLMRSIVVVAFPDGQILDATGPLEVFSVASRHLERTGRARGAYSVELAGLDRGPIRMSSGVEVIATSALPHIRKRIDTLLVAGGSGIAAANADPRLHPALRRLAPRARRLGSVCTGALCLAAAGLLDGKRATTHWGSCDYFARRYPRVKVEPDSIFVRDGKIWTSAGVTAGMDMALAMVEADWGHAVAVEAARHLVMFLQRPGGQSQFSATLRAQHAERDGLRDLPAWIADHLDDDLSVRELARRAHMSPRNFARAFTAELGEPPGRYVERTRVEAAKRKLTDCRSGLEEIAAACGFGTAETMRRAFHRHLKVSPRRYREHFHSPARA